MKVVAISLDPNVLDSKSVASLRNKLYGEIVEGYRVVVHHTKDAILELSERTTVYGVGGTFKVVRLFRVALLLRKLIKEGKCDVITSSDPYFFSFVAYVLAKLYHIGFEAHILGIEKENFIRTSLARFFVRRASAVRVNSTRLRNRVSQDFGVPWKEIAFVPIYIPTEKLGFKKAQEGTRERQEQDAEEGAFKQKYTGRFNIMFAGRLVAIKNIPMQLRALQIIAKTHKEVLLHIVGTGPDEAKLMDLAKNLGVEENVVFEGRKEGVSLGTMYRLCDSFILTSFAEGWPMVIFEAISAGLPVVMTDVGCAGEMIKDEVNGLVVHVDDHEKLAAALTRLIEEEGLKERLAKTATEHLRNYWTRDQILAGYRQSWEKALAHKL